ncbi:M48 family metalloprotease [Denitratimonas sp. CY0512]|uniref:M48 family metalloprotease n=1 Tax=Denitratimonas sp. CY0512 TaxID=3131940 RepID=UPI0030960438
MKRWLLCVALSAALPLAVAQDTGTLPDMGSSAGELLTPAQERAYGGMMVRQLRGYGMVLDDPLLEGYIEALGYRLASRSDQPRQAFTFFLMRSRQVNAFATIGGYIGTNAGLILTAEREDEVAAVLAHEIAHVTQRHVLRAVEQAQRDQLPIMLGMLGAILAASQSGSGDGIQAAIAGGMSLMAQRQINYTRSNEHEADRLGIQTLARAGYEPVAMADFFARMERQMRGNTGGAQLPEYLRSHPVTTTRISEAKARAEQIGSTCSPLQDSSEDTPGNRSVAPCSSSFALAAPRRQPNPLLPDYVTEAISDTTLAPELFGLARERLRVLTAASAAEAAAEYQRLRNADESTFTPAQRYGHALALSLAGQSRQAGSEFGQLAQAYPQLYWIELAQAENEHRSGLRAASQARYEKLLRERPHNTAITLSYAAALAEYGNVEAARTAQELLRPLLAAHGHDPAFQRTFARASEVAGDTVRAAEAHAEVAWLNGRADDALGQLQRLKNTPELDFYQRARIDARIASIMPDALEQQRQNQRGASNRLDAETGLQAPALRLR